MQNLIYLKDFFGYFWDAYFSPHHTGCRGITEILHFLRRSY